MNFMFKTILFLAALYSLPVLGMDVVADKTTAHGFQAPVFLEDLRDDRVDRMHAQLIARLIVRVKAGNMSAQKHLCMHCAHEKTTHIQKCMIANALQEVIKSTRSAECRMEACCALAYVYATCNGPKVDNETFLDKTVRYLLIGYNLTLDNRDHFLLKVQLRNMIDLIVHRWNTELSILVLPPAFRKLLDVRLDLLARLNKDLSQNLPRGH